MGLITDILAKQGWSTLEKRGAKAETKEERISTGWTTREYEIIKLNGYTFEIRQEEDQAVYDMIDDDLESNDDAFIVNYHRDFEVKKDEIITEDEVRELYCGEKDWQKLEREKGYWIFELSCLVHGGIWINFGGRGFISDPQGWDTSRVGLVLVNKKIARTQKKAEEIGRELVERWNKILSNDVYTIIVKKGNKEVDSIGGIIGRDEVYEWINDYTK